MEAGAFASQALKAASALLKHEALVKDAAKAADQNPKAKKSKAILEDLEPSSAEGQKRVYAIVNFFKVNDKVNVKPVKLHIPHPFRSASDKNLRVCLITKDPQRQYKNLVNPLGIPSITKIIGVTKLREKFKPYEARRNLCASFDLFLADVNVIPMLPKLLGKTFFEKKKQPIAVRINPENPQDVSEELQGAIKATFLFQASGSSTSICVGTVEQRAVDLAANAEAVVKLVGKKIAGGLSNVRSVHIKTSDSASLPIYVRASGGQEATAPNH